MLEIPNIKVNAEVAAVLDVLENSNDSVRWALSNYYNIEWNDSEDTLQVCGFEGKSTYETILSCPYIEKIILNKKTDEEFKLLDLGYSILLPIDTKRLGLTETPYYHSIFLTNRFDNMVTVYDFWTPKFKWREKTLNYQLVKQAVDTKQRKGVSPIAIKLNQKGKNHTEKLEVFKLISDYLGYGGSKGKYGFQAYSQWQEYIKNLSNVFYLNHVDFNTLYEHFVVWEGIIKMLQREIGINNEIYSNFIKLENSAIKLRNLSIKFWLKRNAVDDEWRNIIVSKLEEIKQEEKDLLEKLYSENMLET